MHTYSKWLALVLLAAPTCDVHSMTDAEAPLPKAVLQIHSVRVNRTSPEFNKLFPGRYYGGESGPAGVSLQLVLTLDQGALLPLTRDALSIETFVDDTYQNLQSTGDSSSYYSEGRNLLSDDGRTLLFTVSTGRSPAPEAGRVFVRGSVQARLSRGTPTVATNQFPLAIGQGVTVGPFRAITRSLSEMGGGNSLTVMLSIEGDSSAIRRIRLLDSSGKVLNDERQMRPGFTGEGNRASSTSLMLREAPKGVVVIELTYVENVEQVRIPFEAQVDIGVAKAGPVEPADGKSPSAKAPRTWPPPPREKSSERLPPRRSGFQPRNPLNAPATQEGSAKLPKATVDLFSLTVAKPAPSEVKGVEWKTTPSAGFYPGGFTIARLLLSAPNASILSAPGDGVSITRFEDDKGGHLDTALYRVPYSGAMLSSSLQRSPDGEQMLLSLALASAPTPGATRCTLAGNIEAKVARGERTETVSGLQLRRGQSFSAGPFKGEIETVAQVAPSNPSLQNQGQLEIWLSLTGPVARLASIEFLDSAQTVLNQNHASTIETMLQEAQTIRRVFQLASAPAGPITLRLRHYESNETIQVPFEFTTGIGL